MKNRAYRMAMLYDFYGELLTPRQQEFYDLYYNDDLSLAEIAENYDITRQGVRDIIVRAERYLEEIEEKTGLIRRYHRTKAVIASLREVQEEIQSLNQGKNEQLEEIAQRIGQAADDLEEE